MTLVIVEKIYSEKEMDQDAMVSAFRLLDQLYYSGKWDAVNKILVDAPISKMSLAGMILLARGTSRVRIKLPYWKTFVDNAFIEINSRGENGEHVLRGLLD